MKLLTYREKQTGRERAGVSFDGERVFSLAELGFGELDALGFIRALGCRFDAVTPPAGAKGQPLAELELLSPIPRPAHNVLCVGLNYRAHADEYSRAAETVPAAKADAVYFTKNVNQALAPGGEIDGHFDVDGSLDYECELAVILGRDAYRVRREEAGDCVFGFSIANDVTARTLQRGRGQWFLGKSLDTFFPFGPWIVTRDELGPAPALPIRSYVNGELRQNASTGDLIHSAGELLEDLSRGMTLPAGSILLTGTPAGVGMGFTPPRFLRPGDLVRCEIAGIGVLENRVK